MNLAQTEGAEVVFSVGTMVQRLARMAAEPSLGEDGAAARRLLEQRGLNAATRGHRQRPARAARRGRTGRAFAGAEPRGAEQERDVDWYLEWSEIARIAISDRRLLRQLGFLGPKRGAPSAEAGEDEETDAESEEIEAEAEIGAV